MCGVCIHFVCAYVCVCHCIGFSEHERRQRRTSVPHSSTLCLFSRNLNLNSFPQVGWPASPSDPLFLPPTPVTFQAWVAMLILLYGCWASKFSSSCIYSDHSYPLGHLPSPPSASFKQCFPLQIDNWVCPAGREQQIPSCWWVQTAPRCRDGDCLERCSDAQMKAITGTFMFLLNFLLVYYS